MSSDSEKQLSTHVREQSPLCQAEEKPASVFGRYFVPSSSKAVAELQGQVEVESSRGFLTSNDLYKLPSKIFQKG